MESASMQVADVILVSTDTRGFELASALAEKGWKTVVLELDGGPLNRYLELEDRFGPFVSYSRSSQILEGGSAAGALWFKSGPVALAGPRTETGSAHLLSRYGLDRVWVKALSRSLLASRLKRREAFLDSASPSEPDIDWNQFVRPLLKISELSVRRRQAALAAGVRILDVEQILEVRVRDGRIDRIELRTTDGNLLQERTRSAVWMLSMEESKRTEFVHASVNVEALLQKPKILEPLMGWWRSRLMVKGLGSQSAPAGLRKPPEMPSHLVFVGSLERPWTHDNVMAMDLVEKSDGALVYDVWMRLPYWSRADHVYRDEQRVLAKRQLLERLPACEIDWVTPSPIGLSEDSIRMPHVLYSHDSKAPKSFVRNMSFAGPETWRGVGMIGLELCQDDWIKELESLRMDWDPAARAHASRVQKLKYKMQGLMKPESEISP